MPFLAGGHALPLAHKIAISNASFIAMSYELADDEEGWMDNLEDTGAILQFAGTLYVLWVPPVVQAGIAARVGVLLAPLAVPAAIITSTFIVGGFVAAVVDPEEGLENYMDFFAEPGKIPERLKFTAETIYEQKIDPAVQVTLSAASMVYNMAEREVLRKATQIHTGMEEASRWIKEHNRFLTGPYLPF